MSSMYMGSEILTESLTTTVYREYWPVAGTEKDGRDISSSPWDRAYRRDGVSSRLSQRSLQDSSVVVCSTSTRGRTPDIPYNNEKRDFDEDEMMGHTAGFSKLDKTTLQYLGWSSGALVDIPGQEETDCEKQEKDKENIYRLSKVEFKRLTEQVRDVSMNLRNKFRTSAYQTPRKVCNKKLYQQPPPVDNGSQLYRSQLAASLKAFKPKDWPPLNYKELETSFLRCKPINTQIERNPTPPPRYNSPARLRRPRSVPASALRRSETPTDVRPGNFDTLNPRVLASLISDSYGAQTYGDRIIPLNERETENSKECEKSEKLKNSVKDKEDDNSTSGIESSQTDDESSSSSDDEDSDYEPSVDRNRKVPDLVLRPEKLDSLIVPDSAKGWRKYDFDADTVELPPYEFDEPIPEPFNDIDLRQMARLKWNWRDQTKAKPSDTNLAGMLDRLVELERLQIETEEWEQKRYAQVCKRSKRAASGKSGTRDKRCCNKCLQFACTGDCPEKNVQSNICELCRQPFCVSTQCKETKYEQRMRQPRPDDDNITIPKPPLPRACKSCQTKHNAKLINANNLILGRPKSGNVTYSRGQSSLKPKDLRPRCDTPISCDIVKDFDKLGLNPTRPNAPPRIQRPRSRNSLSPGKTFYSQRRDSITESSDKETNTNLKRKKIRTIKVRRPKTAV